MWKYLAVCNGGINRSQMAAGYINHITNSEDAVALGVNPYAEHTHDKPGDLVIRLMREEGIDISENKIRHAYRCIINEAEKILVLCEKRFCPDYIANNEKSVFHYVEDPWNKSLDEARDIRNEIKLNVFSFLNSPTGQ